MDSTGDEIDARFTRAIDAALAAAPRRPPSGFRFALPVAVRGSLAEAARRCGGLPEVLAAHYLDAMPRALVEQMFVADDPAARLLWRTPISPPGLAGALAGLDALLGTTTPTPLASPADLHAGGLFGGSAPLLGASAPQRALMNAQLAAGADPDAVLDHHLAGHLVHELAHGRPAPMPWTILESVAVAVGARVWPRHVFPDEPGEAVPGVSLFACLGDALARLFGWPALLRLLAGAEAGEIFGAPRARILVEAGWQAWLARPTAPMVVDALDVFSWIKLAAANRLEPERPDLLAAAAQVPWTEIPWYQQDPTDADEKILATGVQAMFQVNVLGPTFQTHPAELADGQLVVDLEACELRAATRPAGVYAEPPRWIAPPPYCRRLRERGGRRVVIDAALRINHAAIARRLWSLLDDARPLPTNVAWRESHFSRQP